NCHHQPGLVAGIVENLGPRRTRLHGELRFAECRSSGGHLEHHEDRFCRRKRETVGPRPTRSTTRRSKSCQPWARLSITMSRPTSIDQPTQSEALPCLSRDPCKSLSIS